MKEQGVIKRSLKSTLNVKRWIAWNEIIQGGKSVIAIAKGIFVPQKALHHESYEEAVKRLNLSESDIKQRMQAFFRLAMIYLVMALGLFIYTIYMLIHGHFVTAILCVVLTGLALIYAYREHFWYTQIKYHKFGCTFKEWLNFNLTKKVKK